MKMKIEKAEPIEWVGSADIDLQIDKIVRDNIRMFMVQLIKALDPCVYVTAIGKKKKGKQKFKRSLVLNLGADPDMPAYFVYIPLDEIDKMRRKSIDKDLVEAKVCPNYDKIVKNSKPEDLERNLLIELGEDL